MKMQEVCVGEVRSFRSSMYICTFYTHNLFFFITFNKKVVPNLMGQRTGLKDKAGPKLH